MSTSVLRSVWPLRVVWLVLPVLLGPSVADAFSDRSRAVQVVGALLAWGGWGLGVGALAFLRSSTLTAARLVVPGAVPLAAWCAIGADRPVWAAAGVGAALLCVALLSVPGVADAFVDGSSYGAERRVALRVPLPILLGPLPLTWCAAAASLATGPMLLASESWILGGLAVCAGSIVVAAVFRRMHVLSRRWLVFVPAGVVVHDPLHLQDPVLFPRHLLAGVGPALESSAADPDVVDTSGGATGLVLEIRSHEPINVAVRSGRDKDERADAHALLVTPTQPGATLELARDSHLPVG